MFVGLNWFAGELKLAHSQLAAWWSASRYKAVHLLTPLHFFFSFPLHPPSPQGSHSLLGFCVVPLVLTLALFTRRQLAIL